MHIISISTEIYFDYLKDGVRLLDNQYDWLVNDLKVSALLTLVLTYVSALVDKPKKTYFWKTILKIDIAFGKKSNFNEIGIQVI